MCGKKLEAQCHELCNDYRIAEGQEVRNKAINYCTQRFKFDADADGTVSVMNGERRR
jgi:hypothetical protein